MLRRPRGVGVNVDWLVPDGRTSAADEQQRAAGDQPNQRQPDRRVADRSIGGL